MKSKLNRFARHGLLAAMAIFFGTLIAHAYDTSWISSGQTVSAAKLKADLDEAQTRIAALETASQNGAVAWGLVKVSTGGVITLLNGYNVSSTITTASDGSFINIGFTNALKSPNYAVIVQDGRPDGGAFPSTITYQPDFYSGQRNAQFFLLRSDTIGFKWGAPPRELTFSFVVVGG